MASFNYESTSAADMRAAFPVKSLDPIEGRPNLQKLMKALKVLCRCSKTTKSALGPLGYLFVALPLEHYVRFTQVPLHLPAPTPDVPPYTVNMAPGLRDQVKLQW